MNWTEGALARHSRRKGWKPELVKQKQYFAKVRSGLRDVSKPTVTSVAFLSRQPKLSTAHSDLRSPGVLAQCSPHFQPQQSQHSEAQGSHLGQSPRQRPRENDQSTAGHDFPKLHISPNTKGKRVYVVDNEESLETKRRRLLQRGDWVGINVQKPMSLHFSARDNSAGRQIWGFRDRYTIGKPAPFFEQNGLGKKALKGHATSHSSTQGGDRSVRIRIGSEDIRFGRGSQSTSRSLHKRSFHTISKSINLQHTGQFQDPSHQDLLQRKSASEHPDDRELSGQGMKRPGRRRRRRDAAVYEKATRPALPSTPKRQRNRLERLHRDGHPLVVQSSPSVVHQPVPQRLSQLILLDRLGTPRSNAFGSTVGEVGHNPLSAIPPSGMSENERWHGISASFKGQKDTPSHQKYSSITTAEGISPGVSNFQGPRSPLIHHSGFEYHSMSTLTNLQEAVTNCHVLQGGIRADQLGQFSMSPMPDKLATNNLSDDFDPSQGNTHTAEEVCTWNMSDTLIQRCSSSSSPDSPGKRLPIHHERDAYIGSDCTEPENLSLTSQPPETGTGRNISVTQPTTASADTDWMNFLFGDDGDGAQDTAFREARQEAARDLRPSSTSTNNYCQNPGPPSLGHDTEAVAACRSLDWESEQVVARTSSRCSLGFGLGHTDLTVPRNATSFIPETHIYEGTHTAIAESTIAEAPDSIPPGSDSDHVFTDMASIPAIGSASTMAQPPESEMSEVPSRSFQFARPKTFVGRLAGSLKQEPGALVPLSIHDEPKNRAKPKKGSSKKMKKDSRTDIRGLPDYDGDPIDGGSDE